MTGERLYYKDNEGIVCIISEDDAREIRRIKSLLDRKKEIEQNTVYGDEPPSRISGFEWCIALVAIAVSGMAVGTVFYWVAKTFMG